VRTIEPSAIATVWVSRVHRTRRPTNIRYYHRHKDLASLQRLLGHADIPTTMR
jgi:hypothetical protein